MEIRAKQLAGLALEKLSYQAALHASEPEIYGENYMSVAQLRDDVLRDEFSTKRRKVLWEKVQKKVEGNSNVRAMVREGRTGDVGRVWEWVGAVGYLESPDTGAHRRRSGRVSFVPQVDDSSMIENSGGDTSIIKRPELKTQKWEESKGSYY